MTHTFTFRCDDGKLRDFRTETTSWEDMLWDFLEEHCSLMFYEMGLDQDYEVDLYQEGNRMALEIIGAYCKHLVLEQLPHA